MAAKEALAEGNQSKQNRKGRMGKDYYPVPFSAARPGHWVSKESRDPHTMFLPLSLSPLVQVGKQTFC